MPVQSLSESCSDLYRQGKYKACLAALGGDASSLPPAERAAVMLLAARVKRELLDLPAAVDLLRPVIDLAGQSGDVHTELEASLILHAVQAQIFKSKTRAKELSHQSELLLNRVRKLKPTNGSSAENKRYEALYVTALCELGLTKVYAGDLELAAQNLRLASGLAAEKFGTESVEMIYPSLYLAIVHALEGKHSLSQVMARNATQLVRANYGKHPLVIQPLYRLAQAATKQSLFQQALDTCRQLEGVIVDHIGEANDLYLDTLGMKTAAFKFMVEYQSAEKMAVKRLKLAENLYGKDDTRLIDPLCDLAQILAHLGERERAEVYFDRALNLVTELARNQGFPEDMVAQENFDPATTDGAVSEDSVDRIKKEEAAAHFVGNSAGSRLQGASLCHLEYSLIEQLSDCYLWQGKLADAARLMPASMRSKHICKVDNVVSVIEAINKHLAERARNLDLPT
jgi:tetratricopeptide (TPR) repeat protein